MSRKKLRYLWLISIKGKCVKSSNTFLTTFTKTKFKKSDDQTNIDKYRVAVDITEFHIISKFHILRINIPKFMKIGQLFHVTKYAKKIKKSSYLGTYELFSLNYWVASLSTLYLTVLGIIIPSFKLIGQYWWT